MRRRVPVAMVLCAAITVLAAAPASAASGPTWDPCSPAGKSRLAVDRYDATHLRVLFVIRSGDPGSVWQLFGSDNDHPFVTKTRTADQYGIVRVRWRPLDRAGSDLIKAAGSGSNGNTCSGSVTF